MNTKFLKSVGTMILPCLFATVMVQACMTAEEAAAAAQTVADPIEGLWAEQVTLRNCQSGAVVAMVRAMSLFNRGGTMNNTSTQPPALFGPSFGTWEAQTGGYRNVFRLFVFNPDGSFAQTRTVTRAITLDAGNNGWTATISGEIRDSSDVVVGMTCGTQTATRI